MNRSAAVSSADLRERGGKSGILPLRLAERREQPFDALEEHAHFTHVAAQQPVDEDELVRGRDPVVDELAHVAPMDWRAGPSRSGR